MDTVIQPADSTTSVLAIPMPHTFSMDLEEKQILEASRVDEMHEDLKANGPKLLGVIDARAFLLTFAAISLTGNMVSLYETWDEKYTPLFYFFYSAVTAIGIHGLAERKTLLICVYGAYLFAMALFESAMSGALLFMLAQPDFCHRLASITDLSQAGQRFCLRKEAMFKAGIFGGVLAQVGLDLLVLTQMWKVFQWAEMVEQQQAEGKLDEMQIKLAF